MATMTDISYLIIYNSHNGYSFRIPKPVRFHNLSQFKTFLLQSLVNNQEDVSTDNLFLLTSFGIKLNYNLINEINEIFVYDKRLFANDPDLMILASYSMDKQHDTPSTPPTVSPLTTSLVGNNNLKQLTSNLKTNLNWAKSLNQDSNQLAESCRNLIKQINIIFKSLTLIFQFCTNFINDIDKQFNSYFNYIKLINFKTLHKSWQAHYKTLQTQFSTVKIHNKPIKIVDFLNYNQLNDCSRYIEQNLPLIVKKFNDLGELINQAGEEKLTVDKFIETSRNDSITHFKDVNVNELVNDVQQATKSISNDIHKLSADNKADLRGIYKLHQDEYSRKIFEGASKLFNYAQELRAFKDKLIENSLQIFNKIANLQMTMVSVKSDIRSLMDAGEKPTTEEVINYETINKVKKYEDYLSLTIDLPLLFGFLLIEKRRQFEWYDFYSKGIVNNVSEQLSTIIDHEKLFRSIWIKKFGHFIMLLNPKDQEQPITTSLPNIDVTVHGPHQSDFSILYDLEIERDDIVNYINLLEKSLVSKSFPELLNKNFKDMMKSTNNMKKITKLVSSLSVFTSISNEEKLKILTGGDLKEDDEEDLDIDLNLVRGLKSRIKKLENLLHQQQYKNITSWPVTRNGGATGGTGGMSRMNGVAGDRMSMIIEQKQLSPAPAPSAQKMNPTLLLERKGLVLGQTPGNNVILNNVSSSSSHGTIDTSGIDKHLDNIRLKKLNAELTSKNDELLRENKSKNETIEELRREIDRLKSDHIQEHEEWDKKYLRLEEDFRLFKLDHRLDSKEFDNLNKKIDQRDGQISELQDKINNFTETNSNLSKEVTDLNKTIVSLRNELNDAIHMKNELLSNMSSKESEFSKERHSLDVEIKNLQTKLDDLHEDYEDLLELTSGKQKKYDCLIVDLNNVIVNLMNDIKKLVECIFAYFIEYCLVLESMGLLLVKENDCFKIRRVKGLRTRKGEENESLISLNHPNSKAVDDIEAIMNWIEDIPSINSLIPATAESFSSEAGESKSLEQSNELISTFNKMFKQDSKFDHFVKVIEFRDNVSLQEDGSSTTRFFLNAITKRFRDVEGFAKRQTKESKIKESELKKMMHKLNSKLTMNGFQENDLVLFLPTRIDRVNGDKLPVEESLKQPWAAFNIGAPHYFLYVHDQGLVKDKDWIIGRVKKITEHKVTEENVGSLDENPFQLSIGVVWFMVEAEQQKF